MHNYPLEQVQLAIPSYFGHELVIACSFNSGSIELNFKIWYTRYGLQHTTRASWKQNKNTRL